jgi:hypothetical protein
MRTSNRIQWNIHSLSNAFSKHIFKRISMCISSLSNEISTIYPTHFQAYPTGYLSNRISKHIQMDIPLIQYPNGKRGVCHCDVCFQPPRGWQSALWGVDGADNALVFLIRHHRMAPVTWELYRGPWGRWTAPLKWAAVARNSSFTLTPRVATSPLEC